jgi:hypothetical protein
MEVKIKQLITTGVSSQPLQASVLAQKPKVF